MATLNLVYSGGTLNLLDGSNYIVEEDGWTPAVTYLTDSELEVSDYADVDESMVVTVNGTTRTLRYQNLRKLQQAMDEATRWARGENISAVKIRYAPDGATATNLETVILGRPRGGNNPFNTSNQYAAASNLIPSNTLQFRRRGLWLTATEGSATSSATSSNKVMTATFTAHPLPSPVRITLSNVFITGNTTYANGYLMLASGNSGLQSLSFTSSSYGSSTTQAATGSHSGNVVRFTPATSSSFESYLFDATDLATNIETANIIYPIINYRLNSGGATTFYITGIATLLDGSEITGQTFATTGGGDTVTLPLGAFPINGKLSSFTVLVVTTGAGGAYIELDAFAVLGERDAYASIIAINIPFNDGGTSVGTLNIDHQLLTKPQPLIYHGTNNNNVPYQGDPVFMISGTTVSAIWFANYASTTLANSSAPGGGNHTMTVYRRSAYYLPE